MSPHPYGFRIVGPLDGERRLVDAAAAYAAYAACDPLARVDREGYLSAFQFGSDFRARLEATGSPKGFAGSCWSPWVWWDVDRPGDIECARRDAARLAHALTDHYAIPEEDVLAFYSGSKGFHVGMPSACAGAEPSPAFGRVARRFAERLAAEVGVAVDGGVYDAVRAFRAFNSRHPKTGLHKRRLTVEELTLLSVEAIARMAASPEPFDLPAAGGTVGRSDWNPAVEWRAAAEADAREAAAAASRRSALVAGDAVGGLNQLTLAFIRDGAPAGGDGTADPTAGRHRRLYAAARNLAELGCPPALAHALLGESALDCGLAPADVRRQIECGLRDGAPTPVPQASAAGSERGCP